MSFEGKLHLYCYQPFFLFVVNCRSVILQLCPMNNRGYDYVVCIKVKIKTEETTRCDQRGARVLAS